VTDETLKIESDGTVAQITINRPQRRNALDDATLHALVAAIDDANRAGASAIVLSGEGDVSFCAGSDIKELAGQTLPERIAHTDLGQTVGDRLEHSQCVVIAAIEGYCLGGGLELALACDLRIAGEGSTLGLPEVQINALPSWGGTFRLPRVVGIGRAKEITIFGRRLDAAESLAWGLVSQVTPQGGARERALAVAHALTQVAERETVVRAKQLVNGGYGVDGRVGRQLELLADSAQLASGGFDESFKSFGAKS
jgi:enoyl-CoA hydratase/carnithine racemase